MTTAKKPTHELKYLNKATDEKGKIGVGWENPDGSISIKLNSLVQIVESKNLVLTLFKYDPEFYKKQIPVARPVEEGHW